MNTIPEVFSKEPFPEIVYTRELHGHQILFFDQYDFPSAEQLDALSALNSSLESEGESGTSWSLFNWGAWDETVDLDESDLDERISYETIYAPMDDSYRDLMENFGISSDGEPLNPSGATVDVVDDEDEIFDVCCGFGLVAVSCPSWETLSVCEWPGCANVGSSVDLAAACRYLFERFGGRVIAFGDEPSDADLLLQFSPASSDSKTELIALCESIGDEVYIHQPSENELLVHLWFD